MANHKYDPIRGKMKKKFFTAMSLAAILLLSGCATTGGATKSTPSEASQTPIAEVQKDDWTNYLTSTIVEFSVSKAECSYSKGSLEALIKFKNISDKTIVAIEASGTVNNVFGEKQMGIDLSESKKVAPGKTVNAGSWGSSCWSLNQFISEQIGLLDMDPETIKLVVEVSKIAFDNGEILEF